MKFTFKNISENISPIENETILADDSVKASPALKSNSDISINSYYEDNTPSNSSQIQIPVYSQSQFITLLPGEQIDIITDDSVQIEYYTNVVDALKTKAYNFAECEISDEPGPTPPPTDQFIIHSLDYIITQKSSCIGNLDIAPFVVGDYYDIQLTTSSGTEDLGLNKVVSTSVGEGIEAPGVFCQEISAFSGISVFINEQTGEIDFIEDPNKTGWAISNCVEDGAVKDMTFTFSKLPAPEPQSFILPDDIAFTEGSSAYINSDEPLNLIPYETYVVTLVQHFGGESYTTIEEVEATYQEVSGTNYVHLRVEGMIDAFDKATWTQGSQIPTPSTGAAIWIPKPMEGVTGTLTIELKQED